MSLLLLYLFEVIRQPYMILIFKAVSALCVKSIVNKICLKDFFLIQKLLSTMKHRFNLQIE